MAVYVTRRMSFPMLLEQITQRFASVLFIGSGSRTTSTFRLKLNYLDHSLVRLDLRRIGAKRPS